MEKKFNLYLTCTQQDQKNLSLPQTSFEDKRKENFEKGQAELERRRKALLEVQRKEQDERERKERDEAEKLEKIRLVQRKMKLPNSESQSFVLSKIDSTIANKISQKVCKLPLGWSRNVAGKRRSSSKCCGKESSNRRKRSNAKGRRSRERPRESTRNATILLIANC